MTPRSGPRRRLLLTGASGLVGANLYRHASGSFDFIVCRKQTPFPWPLESGDREVVLDLGVAGEAAQLVAESGADGVVHSAAIARLGDAQNDPALAERINFTATVELARACAERDLPFVFFSTDQVFDGEAAPYRETDPPAPLAEYGKGKARAEQAVLEVHPRALVLRLALVLAPPVPGHGGALGSFIDTATAGGPARLFVDEFRTPVSVFDVARQLQVYFDRVFADGLESAPCGLAHAGGRDRVDRYQLGEAVAAALGLTLELQRSSRLDMPYARPRDVSLLNTVAEREAWPAPTPLDEALAEIARFVR